MVSFLIICDLYIESAKGAASNVSIFAVGGAPSFPRFNLYDFIVEFNLRDSLSSFSIDVKTRVKLNKRNIKNFNSIIFYFNNIDKFIFFLKLLNCHLFF